MTDNGSSFRSRRYAKALRWLKIKHLRTKPYTPKTNGKAERFVQTSLARMGLRPSLQHLRTTRRRAPCLAAPLQLASPTWQYRLQAANQQARSNHGQPVEAPQLGGGCFPSPTLGEYVERPPILMRTVRLPVAASKRARSHRCRADRARRLNRHAQSCRPQ
jgi:hypothetical protein